MNDDTNSPFHPDNLRLDTGGEVWAVTPKKIRRRRKHFTLVPGVWKERLTKVRHIAAYRVALHILMRDFETNGEPFTLSNGALALENVGRGTKWRALRELERFDLITIERRARKSPRITALHTDIGRRKK
jgi:hypothetical protein